MILLLCDVNSQPFVAILRYLGSKGRTKQIPSSNHWRVTCAEYGHHSTPVEWNVLESKSVERRSLFTGFRWFCFPAISLAELLSCLQKAHLTFSDRFLISPGQRHPLTTNWYESTVDGGIWLAGVIDKRSNKRLWTTLVAKFIVSEISEIHLGQYVNRVYTMRLTHFAVLCFISRALIVIEYLRTKQNH